MKKLLLLSCILTPLLVFAAQPGPIEVVFDAFTNLLRIPQVRVGDSYVYDAQLQFIGNNTFILQSYQNTPPEQPPQF